MREPPQPRRIDACPRCLVRLHSRYQQLQLCRKRIDNPTFLVQFAPKLPFEVEESYSVREQRSAGRLLKHSNVDLPHKKYTVKAPCARQKYVLPSCQVGIKREGKE